MDRPNNATVTWDSRGLRIEASNSSLQQILRDVSVNTGAKIEGLGQDQRVYGSYGPGQARDVLYQLLQGSGYNILLAGDLGQGTPRQIFLSPRHAGGANAPGVANAPPQDNNEEDVPEDVVEEPPQPPPPPQPQGADQPAAGPAGGQNQPVIQSQRPNTYAAAGHGGDAAASTAAGAATPTAAGCSAAKPSGPVSRLCFAGMTFQPGIKKQKIGTVSAHRGRRLRRGIRRISERAQPIQAPIGYEF